MSKLLSKYEGLLLLVGVIGILMALALWFIPSAGATFVPKVNICHCEQPDSESPFQCQTLHIAIPAAISHLTQHDADYSGVCEVPEPTPEITPTPEVTPTPEPECDGDQCEPTPTPEPRLPDQLLTPAGAGAGAPVCTDGNTILLPAGFQVKRAGPDATYIWFQTQADQVNLYYKELGQENWTHAVANVPAKAGAFPDNYNEYTVHALNPSLGYVFGLQQIHGCGGGQLVTAVVIDGPVSRLFPFSYWEWNK